MKPFCPFLLALVAGILLVASGCGEKLGTVTGKVTVDGEPVSDLEVTFIPVDAEMGTDAIGFTNEQGEYKLIYGRGNVGAPIGDYRVTIAGAELDGDSGEPYRLPPKYSDRRQTELTATVEGGENTINFELEK
jgi:hypothetical protein